MQYSDVNASIAWRDSTHGPFWSLISECDQAEKILSSTQGLEGVYMPRVSWPDRSSERPAPSHSVYLRRMQ